MEREKERERENGDRVEGENREIVCRERERKGGR